ncbi:MAG: protease SohB [Gammaproteobacteria bacterium]|jgi:serine protease SohB|nr:protease SohB [Gammaproteobacteria bacterium]
MEFLAQYGMFALKTFTLVLAILFLLGGIFALRRKPKNDLTITHVNKEYKHLIAHMEKEILGKKSKKPKAKKKSQSPVLYVLDFNGDIKASQVESLREEVSAILAVATNHDEVLIRIDSPGGAVNGYGLAAAQLQRLRDNNVSITACVDKVAASGGYLMACVAHQIIAAPFAIVGSIGVVAQMPNFHRWLQKHDVDVELLTAGEYKRTLTVFGKNTAKGRAKFQAELELIHQNFRDYVLTNRSEMNIDEVATGEHWLAVDALALGLIDQIQTSDEFIINKLATHQAYHIAVHRKSSLLERILKPTAKLLHPYG